MNSMDDVEHDLRRVLREKAARVGADETLPSAARSRIQRRKRRRSAVVACGVVVIRATAVGLVARDRDGGNTGQVATASAQPDCGSGGAPDYLRLIAFDSVATSNPRPATAEFVKTTRLGAESVASDPNAVVPDDEPAYLMQIAGGSFDVPRGPPGGPASKASVLTFTVSIARQFTTDGGYTDRVADLSVLGPVGHFSLDPACKPPPPPGPPQCTQLAVTFETIHASTQTAIGEFWIRNTGSSTCALHAGLAVDLNGPTGLSLVALSNPSDPYISVELQPMAQEPTNPPPSGLAVFRLQWHELDVANGGAPCPTAPLTPTQIVATFDGGAAQIVVAATPVDASRTMRVCGSDVVLVSPQPLN